jgi:hypothetical protein
MNNKKQLTLRIRHTSDIAVKYLRHLYDNQDNVSTETVRRAKNINLSLAYCHSRSLKGLSKNPYGCTNGDEPGDRTRSSIIH